MDAKELIDGGAKSGGRRKRVEFVDTSVLSELSSWDDKSYATTYVNLDKVRASVAGERSELQEGGIAFVARGCESFARQIFFLQ